MNLTQDTFLLYAMHSYENPHCKSMNEFKEDLSRPKYIKRLFARYLLDNELKQRLILNHIIIFRNIFGVKPAVRMLYFTIDQEFWGILTPFLISLDYIDKRIQQIDGRDIIIGDILVDKYVCEQLKDEYE